MKRALLTLTAVLVTACSNEADTGSEPVAMTCVAQASQTRHQIGMAQGALEYTACAGTLPVSLADGSASGEIFYTAYLAPVAPGETRPLSFIWNGGPGADSRLLHFHALGPQTFQNGVLTPNAGTPLAASDLVFMDPVGTGFSRADDPQMAAAFYGTVADIEATASFVRAFQSAYERQESPLFLAGESFGTWRATGTGQYLLETGTPVTGIALISGGIPLGENPDRALGRALSLVDRAATALALGEIQASEAGEAAFLAEVEHWARQVYYPALSDPAALTSEARDALVARLAAYQGLSADQIDAQTLWVSPREFRTLLPGEERVLNVFDMRIIHAQDAPAEEDHEAAQVLSYYRDTLGYQAGVYAGLEGPSESVGGQWRYDQAPITEASLARAMAGEGPPSPSRPWTLEALEADPRLRIWVAAGLYDSLNSCVGNEAVLTRLPEHAAARITLACYAGGHMMYEDPRVRDRFASDITAFLSGDR
ncbi:peptidase S10 [Oceanicaulis sp. LC35]|uniref:S10 family serine carboxypeptidase-like protein n=1 Tax=Oceanicaulis sp. LC35 TaxID=3349635 RepID=UPI003F87730A